MRLIQAKVRCVRGVVDSGWFAAGKTTLIHGPAESVTALLTALAALNPRIDLDRTLPFAGHPQVWQQRGFARPVIGAKKTAVYMIFGAEADEVRQLGEIDPALFETDRLEVGRRLDHSRWLSFVEISESGRWREISEDMQYLAQASGPEAVTQFTAFAAGLRGTDRLKGHLGAMCCALLDDMGKRAASTEQDRLIRCRDVARRYQRFERAGRWVYSRLPRTLYMAPQASLSPWRHVGDTHDDGRLIPEELALADLMNSVQRRAEQHGLSVVDWLEESGGKVASLVRFLNDVRWPVPRLKMSGGDLVLHDIPADSCKLRCYRLALLLMLARYLGEVPPVVLADGFLQGFDKEQKAAMGSVLLQMVSWGQLLVGGDGADADLADWPQRQEIGMDGKVNASCG